MTSQELIRITNQIEKFEEIVRNKNGQCCSYEQQKIAELEKQLKTLKSKKNDDSGSLAGVGILAAILTGGLIWF